MHRINLQPSAHIQEVGHSPGLQHSVDSHPAPWRGIQQVLEDLQVCQEVHGYGHHLGKRREGGDSNAANQRNSSSSSSGMHLRDFNGVQFVLSGLELQLRVNLSEYFRHKTAEQKNSRNSVGFHTLSTQQQQQWTHSLTFILLFFLQNISEQTER